MSTPPVSMFTASATSLDDRLAAAMRSRSGTEHQLRQVELEVGVDAADAGHGGELLLQFAREAADFVDVLAGQHELQRLAALAAADDGEGRGEGARAGIAASSRRTAAITSCWLRLRSSRGAMRTTTVPWLTWPALPRPIRANSVRISG
jgi:hypothetical protein